MISSDNEVFFEVSYEGNVIESGYSEYGMWIVDNLQEGWYDFHITDDNSEDHMMHFNLVLFTRMEIILTIPQILLTLELLWV